MSRPLRVIVGSVGWTGHLYPALALARALAGRGHSVRVETFERHRGLIEDLGLGFLSAPEEISFPDVADEAAGSDLVDAVAQNAARLRELRPDAVVADLFTLVPAFAAELATIPRATLIPHPYPVNDPGLPYYPFGLMPARTAFGRMAWRAGWPALGTRLPNTRLRWVRATLDAARAALGLRPLADFDGQISDQLALVATFPQLEYPRRWPLHVHVTGPMPFELPHPEIELPEGDRPLVLVAPSTERDPEQRLVRTTLNALADEPVRVLATTNRPGTAVDLAAPPNARVLEWVPYTQALEAASAIVTHGGHGTVARALLAGVPVVAVPPAGDMAVNAARVAWAGAGLMLPWRLLGRASLRVAVRAVRGDPSYGQRASELARWSSAHDGAAAAAALVERLARPTAAGLSSPL